MGGEIDNDSIENGIQKLVAIPRDSILWGSSKFEGQQKIAFGEIGEKEVS
jgi:hypothetical protein